jgi:DNA excision repair protein ERCC-2
LQVGAQIHTLIQTEKKSSVLGYRSEVFVQVTLPLPGDGAELEVSGRIDGLYENTDLLVVEEIKTTTNLHGLYAELLHGAEHPYVLQAKMYGWMLEAMGVAAGRQVRTRLLLVSVHDPEETRALDLDPAEHPWEAFDAWVALRARDLADAARVDEARQARRRAEGESLPFPFDAPRPGQMDLVAVVDEAIGSGERLLLQAPTGLGKTAAVLFPHLRDALRAGKQVFYLTPKNSQHRIAQEAIERMRDRGAVLRSVVITAKEKSCLKDEVICDPKYCEFAKGYYDKLKATGVLEHLAEAGAVDAETLREAGLRHEVCPFELSLDFTARADVVICDYNYVFSPAAALTRYFEDDARSHLVNAVIDEAHNLYARAMDLYSPSISLSTLAAFREKGLAQIELLAHEGLADAEAVAKLKKRYGRLVDRACEVLAETSRRKVSDTFVKERGALRGSTVVTPDRESFTKFEASYGRFMTVYAEKLEMLRPTDPLYELYRLWSEFCGVLRLDGEEFVFTWQETAEEGTLQCTCCDASRFLRQRISSLGAVTGFSATLKPFDFYARMSGFDAEATLTREFASPFPRENRKLVLIPQVSTTFKDRDRNYPKVAEIIERVLPLRKGNTFVFFPSFAFLAEVERVLRLPGFRVLAQRPGMTAVEQRALLAKFAQKTKNVVVLAVQGGVFAEGIDLPGDALECAIVVGPSLPTFSLERECVRAYYDRRYGRGKGFDYAYVYPAMARVVQAAGRVIRTPEDRGLILLCDKRFLQRSYMDVMPSEWLENGPGALLSGALLKDVSDFWNGTGHSREDDRVPLALESAQAFATESESARPSSSHERTSSP